MSSTVAFLWEEIRSLAERESELLLRGCVARRVLQHATLERGIAHGIAASLKGDDFDESGLFELAHEVQQTNRDIVEAAASDLRAYVTRDPACEHLLSAFLHYKGFLAIQCHRVSHALWLEDRRGLSRILQARIAMVFGMDIHPGARIGRGLFVDHGTGIVIGETCVIDDDVSMLHGVTLGGTGKVKGDRHPKIRNGVLLGAGATVLGNIEVGAGSKVAAGSVVLQSVPPHVTVAGVPAEPVGAPSVEQPSLEMAQDLES